MYHRSLKVNVAKKIASKKCFSFLVKYLYIHRLIEIIEMYLTLL